MRTTTRPTTCHFPCFCSASTGPWILREADRARAAVTIGGGGEDLGRASRRQGCKLILSSQWRDQGGKGLILMSLVSDVNYFFGLTTTISPDQRQLLCTGQGRSPVAVWVLLHKIKGLVVGAVGMWESRSDFQGAVGRVENLVLVFQAFHGTVISTALRFSWLIRLRPGFPLADSSWRARRGNWEYSVR
jgi:hypothetical protein